MEPPRPRVGIMTAARRVLRACRILVMERGYWASVRTQAPVGGDGSAIPWYTYPCIEHLETFQFTEKCIFEFGAGGSSAFWARRARSVVSVDVDPEWYSTVSSSAAPNQKVVLARNESTYVGTLADCGQEFDVIVVDGAWRRACAEAAVRHLAAGGMIILDNSDRTPRICEMLRMSGFFQIDFNGAGPINSYCWTTSVFIRSETTLQAGYRPAKPVGGLGVLAE